MEDHSAFFTRQEAISHCGYDGYSELFDRLCPVKPDEAGLYARADVLIWLEGLLRDPIGPKPPGQYVGG